MCQSLGSDMLPKRLGGSPSLCLVVGFLACLPRAQSQAVGEAPAPALPLTQRQPLKVGAFTDAFPYSYEDENGHLAGFTVDLLDAVAKAVNLRIERVSGPADQIRQRFQDGQFTMLQYHGISPARLAYSEFSVPFLSLQGCVYVKDGSPIHQLKDLNDLPFGVIGTTGQGEKLLRDNTIKAQIISVQSQEDLLEKLESGEVAGIFMSQLSELSVARKLHLVGIRMLGRPMHGYEIRQAFAVHPGDAELLARLNEGLAVIHSTGEYDRIYRKNFGQYGSYILSANELELYASIVLGMGFIAALWGFFRQRKLRNELTHQAAMLAEQGSLLKALHDNIPIAITVIEPGADGPCVISMNRQACSLYSIDEDAKGGSLDSLPISEDVRQHLREASAAAPEAGLVTTREVRLEIGRRTLESTAVPLSGSGIPVVSRVCVLVEDITNRLQNDAEVARSRKLRAVGELVGGIAHEFNNLLTPVMLKAGEIQLSRPDDLGLQQDIDVIVQAVQRTAELTRRLLTFGRKIDHGAEAVRLETIAAGCFDLLRDTVDRRITWESSMPATLPALYFNATDLNQILLNLLLNARDSLLQRLAGPNPPDWSPLITVEGAQLPSDAFDAPPGHRGKTLLGWQRLSVRDNGLGMEAGVVERIFEPFFTTKEVGKGTGLGLATVWHLVNEAGGWVGVESTFGAGCEFRVFLPVWPTVAKPKAPVVISEPVKPSRILLIEDEPLVALPIVEILKRNGHQIQHIKNGSEAWQHIQENQLAYDLLIIDVNLPGMNGIDIVSRVRALDFRGRILMISGRLTPADISALTRLRIDQSLSKPFNVQQFLDAVHESLETGTRL
jgi:two-component system cell cycle sensor histidine kinase/response regulator CckA